MTVQFQAVVPVSTTVTGPVGVVNLDEGGWQALIAVDVVPTAGDSVKVGFYQSLDGGGTYVWLWSVTIDDTWTIEDAVTSPVIPITVASDCYFFAYGTIVTDPIDWRVQVGKVADLVVA